MDEGVFGAPPQPPSGFWVLMSQAAPPRTLALAGPAEGRHDALSPGLAHLVVGSVTLLVTGVLEGHPPPPGVSVEVSLPWPRMDHRRWPTHPLCPGHAARPWGTTPHGDELTTGGRAADGSIPRGA